MLLAVLPERHRRDFCATMSIASLCFEFRLWVPPRG